MFFFRTAGSEAYPTENTGKFPRTDSNFYWRMRKPNLNQVVLLANQKPNPKPFQRTYFQVKYTAGFNFTGVWFPNRVRVRS